MKLFYKVIFLVLPVIFIAADKSTIEFESKDGIKITADMYKTTNDNAPLILLFHQAGWSRGEYLEIAPQLNKMGYNCIAVDQRSGGIVNDVENMTAKRAKQAGKNTTYIDAYQDLQAALEYGRQYYTKEKVIIWGSSYSASLVIRLASENPESVAGLLAFAPGEYFIKLGKGESFIKDAAAKVECPVFITSALDERSESEPIFLFIKSAAKTYFLPQSKGNHGSRALWKQFDDHLDYWTAVTKFLQKYFPVKTKS